MGNRRNKRSHWRIWLIVLTALVPLVFFSFRLKPWQAAFSPSALVQELTFPAQYLWSTTLTTTLDLWQSYLANVNATDENRMLRRQLSMMRTRMIDYEEQLNENGRLRKMIGFGDDFSRELIAARVINAPQIYGFSAVRVNRGKMDGVFPGMPAVTPEGIVGRVVRVGIKHGDVQLLTDPNFTLDVILQRTRVRGVLQGSGDGRCLLQLSRRADIKIGDTVVTSGIIGGTPKGLPVGRVMRISYESDNITQKITIEPWLDHRTLEEVMVIQQIDATLQKIVETAGLEWLDHSIEVLGGG